MEIKALGESKFKLSYKGAAVTVESGRVEISGKTRQQPLVIEAPGEYEAEGVSVFGIGGAEETIMVVFAEELKVCHLNHLTGELNSKQIEAIGSVDVLITGPEGAKAIDQLEPAIVIPMGEKQAELLKELGAEGARKESKLTISKLDLPEDREVVML